MATKLGAFDYITNYTMILVYTDTDKAYFTYGTENTVMYEVKNSTYEYREYEENGTQIKPVDEHSYKHIFALIVPAIDDKIMTSYDERVKTYKENVHFTSDSTKAGKIINKDPVEDVNGTGKVNLSDITAVLNVQKTESSYVLALMEIMIRADVDGSKYVNGDDLSMVSKIAFAYDK